MLKAQINGSCVLSLPLGIPALPGGWLSSFDASVLFTAARRMVPGSTILEVGSWIGRSSCAIAYGLQEGAGSSVRYDIIDYGIAGAEEWSSRFGSNIFHERDAEHFCEVVMFPGGTGALLKKNLVDRRLNKFVNLIVLGDVKNWNSMELYDFVFCDATHGPEEIKKNIPVLHKYLKDDYILICDDIVTTDDAELVAELTGATRYYLTSESESYCKMGIFTRGSYGAAFG
jgi:predicted O-methyltransferase YrrM